MGSPSVRSQKAGHFTIVSRVERGTRPSLPAEQKRRVTYASSSTESGPGSERSSGLLSLGRWGSARSGRTRCVPSRVSPEDSAPTPPRRPSPSLLLPLAPARSTPSLLVNGARHDSATQAHALGAHGPIPVGCPREGGPTPSRAAHPTAVHFSSHPPTAPPPRRLAPPRHGIRPPSQPPRDRTTRYLRHLRRRGRPPTLPEREAPEGPGKSAPEDLPGSQLVAPGPQALVRSLISVGHPIPAGCLGRPTPGSGEGQREDQLVPKEVGLPEKRRHRSTGGDGRTSRTSPCFPNYPRPSRDEEGCLESVSPDPWRPG